MADWVNMVIKEECLGHDTGKAMVITIGEWSFWHPSKLIRPHLDKQGEEVDGFVSIGFTNEFQFKMFKNGTGSQRFVKLSEETMSIQQFLAYAKQYGLSLKNKDSMKVASTKGDPPELAKDEVPF